LLIAGYARAHSGFGRVCRGIAAHLAGRYDVHHFGVDLHGASAASGSGEDPAWSIHANPDASDPWGLRTLPAIVARLRPDVILLNAPPGPLSSMNDALPDRRARRIGYAAMGARTEVWGVHVKQLQTLDRLVVYTAAARNWIRRVADGAGVEPPAIDEIPHAIDHDAFHPLVLCDGRPDRRASRAAARAHLFPGRSDLTDAFIVLNANQNQPHKRVDLTIAAFARFAAGRPNGPYLFLHMGLRRDDAGAIIAARDAGVADRVLSGPAGEHHPCVADADLNVIYNACDVGLNTSTTEGWGLCAWEHAAAGAAQIVPGTDVLEEIWGDAADVVVPTGRTAPGAPPAVNPDDVATALGRLHDDRGRLDAMSDAAWRHATRAETSWTSVADRWDALIQRLLGDS